jgi:hypothetical protein
MVLFSVLTGCIALHPPGWHDAQTESFRFALPPDFTKSSLRGQGQEVAQYTNANVTITFDDGPDFGQPLDSLNKFANYSSHVERMAGTYAQIASFDIPPGPSHRFNYCIAASYRGIGLTVYAHCRTRGDYPTAIAIFKTVRLKRPL